MFAPSLCLFTVPCKPHNGSTFAAYSWWQRRVVSSQTSWTELRGSMAAQSSSRQFVTWRTFALVRLADCAIQLQKDRLPLRSCSEPLGVCSLKPQEIAKVMQSNREWETVLRLVVQKEVVFPGDPGCHVSSGPASPWSSREVHDIECTCDVRRGSAFLCQLAGTDQRRPVGIFMNLWSDAVTNYCTTVPFLYRASVCRSINCSEERMRRRTSRSHLPSHRVCVILEVVLGRCD